MEKLYEVFYNLIRKTETGFKRYLHSQINWDNRLIAIKGARGTGKTTLILQHIKENFKINEGVLYISLDNIWFTENKLIDIADDFVKNGGKFLFVDEVHKYPDWSIEIKNIYDQYPELHLVFTGSSMLHINKAFGDLSRRAATYELNGLSFREFLEIEKHFTIEPPGLKSLLANHVEISNAIVNKIKPLPLFRKYLEFGYYPYFVEDKTLYHQRLLNTINVVLETDLQAIEKIDYNSIYKIKKLLYIISTIVPFTPNILKLSRQIDITRPTLLHFLEYLKNAHVINLLHQQTKGISLLSKPEKIYLNNTNIAFALANEKTDQGNIRETFFLNQLKAVSEITSSIQGDFKINDSIVFEIGGKNKTLKQISNQKNAYLAIDGIETGYKNTIPLWMFGLLY